MKAGQRMKAEQRQLSWRFIFSIALMAATVGAAIMAARWTGPLG
jgi:hypothetical protein